MNRFYNLSKLLQHTSLIWMVLFISLLFSVDVCGADISVEFNSTTAPTPSEGTLSYTSGSLTTTGYKISSTDGYVQWILDGSTISAATFSAWINSTSTSYTIGYCFSTDGGSTWGTQYTVTSDGTKKCGTYTTSNVPSGANAIRIIRTAGTSTYICGITLTTSSTSPTINLSASTLSGIDANIYGTATYTDKFFNVTGTNLTNDAIITAPTGFKISTDGNNFSQTLTLSQSSGSISETKIYVRCTASATGDQSGTLTATSTGATEKDIALTGTVYNVVPLNTPSVGTPSDATSGGFTANWTEVSNAVKYTVYVYKASDLSTAVSTVSTTSTASSLDISGLDPLTSYVYKVMAIGDGNNYANSELSSVSSSITTLKSSNAMTACLTEGFESIVGTDNSNSCPSSGDVTNTLRISSGTSTSMCSVDFILSLGSGNWPVSDICGRTATPHSGSYYLYIYRDGYVTTPNLEMPKKMEFYVYNINDQAADKTDRGFKILVDGAKQTQSDDNAISVDDVVLTESTSVVPSITSDGIIRLGNSGSWHKISINLKTTNKTVTIQPVAGSSSSDMYLDDITVYCDPQELTITPDVSGLDYVEDLGPSQTATVTLTGTSLPIENGTATVSCNNAYFQYSLDGGTTWSSGTQTFSYTGDNFTKSMLVRLAAGFTAGASGSTKFSDVLTLTSSGYQKTNPSVDISGKVTLYPVTANCGEEVNILNLNGTESTLNLVDAETGDTWSTSGTVSSGTNMVNAYCLDLKSASAIISPAANATSYDFKTLSFDLQPASGTSSNIISVQLCNGSDCVVQTTSSSSDYSTKDIYHYEVDLSNAQVSGSYTLKIQTTGKEFYIWNVKLTGTAKRKITFVPGTISDFQSYSDCNSGIDTMKIYGTCLDDDSNLKFTSLNNYYQFSTDAVSWSDTPFSLNYSGEYPLAGENVYIRQKSNSTSGNISDNITVTNNGKGYASFVLSGNVASSSDWTPADGTNYTFSSISGLSDTVSIPIVGGEFCAAPIATTSCSGLTISNCKTGTYSTSTSFSNIYTDRTLYLKYIPGTLSNCSVNITAGGQTHTIYINWNGVPVVSNGVQFLTSTVSVPVSSYGSVNVKKNGSEDPIVTISSSKFDFSTGNPVYGDFKASTSYKLSELQGTLYIKPKSGVSSGDSENVTFSTAGGDTVSITVTAQ